MMHLSSNSEFSVLAASEADDDCTKFEETL